MDKYVHGSQRLLFLDVYIYTSAGSKRLRKTMPMQF